jgi:putative membrane protein
MNPKFSIISKLATVAVAASSIGIIGIARAQTDTGIGTNPHLRAASAPTQPGATAKMSQKDVNFIQKAASGGAQEVANGKMAEKQGKSADVKTIAARMVADHTKLGNELTALSSRKGVTFNTSGIKAQNLGSGNFDALYLKWLELVHKADIAEFQKAAKSGDDSDLRAWASKSLPIVKEHLAMVESAEKKMGVR